ncbi:hypothetical protein BconGalA64_32300 [Burkholderia contaminans]|nr:hypothetical protein BconGalA64_32300 [Burkholderia contaminans]
MDVFRAKTAILAVTAPAKPRPAYIPRSSRNVDAWWPAIAAGAEAIVLTRAAAARS